MIRDLEDRIQLQADRIKAEVSRAMNLHAPMNSAHEAYAVILEELDEFWDEVKVNPRKLSDELRTERRRKMQDELLQIAAMCIRATVDCNLMG